MSKIDLAFLKGLMNDDQKMVDRFVEIFKGQVPLQFHDLKNFSDQGDWENISNTAHSLKSQFNYLRLQEFAESMKKIEEYADMQQELSAIKGIIHATEPRLHALFLEEWGEMVTFQQ